MSIPSEDEDETSRLYEVYRSTADLCAVGRKSQGDLAEAGFAIAGHALALREAVAAATVDRDEWKKACFREREISRPIGNALVTPIVLRDGAVRLTRLATDIEAMLAARTAPTVEPLSPKAIDDALKLALDAKVATLRMLHEWVDNNHVGRDDDENDIAKDIRTEIGNMILEATMPPDAEP